MSPIDFENALRSICADLTTESKKSIFSTTLQFETAVRVLLGVYVPDEIIDFNPHPHVFPDICVGKFGIEVKHTLKDSWRCVGNSILETTRNADVENIYVIFGKMGGDPEVRFDDYGRSIVHVRATHAPRFEIEIDPERPLFERLGIDYLDFKALSLKEKMHYVKQYTLDRKAPEEELWWLV
jgi:hypothetical protein